MVAAAPLKGPLLRFGCRPAGRHHWPIWPHHHARGRHQQRAIWPTGLNLGRLGVNHTSDLCILVEHETVLVQAGVRKASDVCADLKAWLAGELAEEDVVAARVGGGPGVGADLGGRDVDGEGAGHAATRADAPQGGDQGGSTTLLMCAACKVQRDTHREWKEGRDDRTADGAGTACSQSVGQLAAAREAQAPAACACLA